MIPKDLEGISEKDINDLMRDGITESLTLECKEKLNFQTDEERKELLADIAFFANVSGGDIIYGSVLREIIIIRPPAAQRWHS